MPYGTIKVDNITFTDNSVDKTVSLSGLIQNPTFTGNVTVTGTISGDVIRGGTTISGVTITGTTANFVSGVFTTQVSGATIIATTGTFTSLTGTTTTGTTANFVSGVFTTQLSGVTVTGTTANFTSGNFISLSGTTTTVTSGVFSAGSVTAPSVAVGTGTTYKPGIYSPGTDQLAISTNGTGRLFVDGSGNVGVSDSSPSTNTIGAGAPTMVLRGTSGAQPTRSAGLCFISQDGTSKTLQYHDINIFYTQSTTATAQVWFTNNLERMRIRADGTVEIKGAGTAGVSPAVSVNPSAPANSAVMDSSGRLGLGTSGPTQKLTVAGNILALNAAGTDGYINAVTTGIQNTYLGFNNSGSTNSNGVLNNYSYVGNGNAYGLQFLANGAVAATLDTSGRLGIGTNSPTESVHTAGALRVTGTQTAAGTGIYLDQTSGVGNVSVYGPDASTQGTFRIYTATSNGGTGSVKLTLDSSGRVGIGTSSPTNTASFGQQLQLTGNLPCISIDNTGTGANKYSLGVNSSGALGFWDNTASAYRMYINSSGNVGIGTTGPQAELNVAKVGGASTVYIESDAGNNATTSILRFGGASGRSASIQGFRGASSNIQSLDFYTYNSADAFGMRLTSTGLGIGSTSPSYPLHISSALDASLYIEEPGNNTVRLKAGTSASFIGTTSNHPFYFTTNNTERARIDSSGRLLVGTSTARANLYNSTYTAPVQIEGTGFNTTGLLMTCNINDDTTASVLNLVKSRGTAVGSNTLVSSGDAVGYISFAGSDGTEFVQAATITACVDGTPGANDMPGRLVFSTTADNEASPTERMRINRAGQISSYALAGASSFNLVLSHGSAASSSTWMIAGAYGATGVNTGTTSFLVATNGNVTNTNNSYGAISDAKLKENIVDATPQWDDLKALQVRKYNFKEGQTHTQIGLVAQEVELISPGLVTESPDRDKEGNDLGTVTKSVNYSVLYMKAVKALQEAMERIESLEASNADMLARLTTLEAA